MMKETFEEKDGKVYVVKNCPKCGSRMMLHLEERSRVVYGACRNCNKPFDAFVPSLKDYEKENK